MEGFPGLLQHAAPFLAVLSRFAGLFIFAPILGSQMIPRRVKALLALALAASVYPLAAPQIPAEPLTPYTAVAIVVSETLIGLCIGMIASLPIVSVQLAGLLMGQQMGLGFAAIYNPATETEGDIIGQMLLYAALGAFLALDGLEAMHGALARTFVNVPVGGFDYAQAPLGLVTGLVASGFELALRVAAPVLCLLMAETIVIGFLMRTVPQINIMTLGFPVKVLVGMIGVVGSVVFMIAAARVEVAESIDLLIEWALSLRPAAGG